VVGEVGDAPCLLRPVAYERPDVAIVDIRMPLTHTDEGLTAIHRIRAGYPATAVILLSQYIEPRYAQRLLANQARRRGIPAQRAGLDIAVLVDALRRVTEG
jgi:DNA-binding NarL/FixJ family response regulator